VTSALHRTSGSWGTLIRVADVAVASTMSNRLYSTPVRNSALYGVGLGSGIKKSFREPLKLQTEVSEYMSKHLPPASALQRSYLTATRAHSPLQMWSCTGVVARPSVRQIGAARPADVLTGAHKLLLTLRLRLGLDPIAARRGRLKLFCSNIEVQC
jgi:hypothetical protein